MTEILMQNNTDDILIIAGRTPLGQVVEYKANACYQAHIDTVGAAPLNVHCRITCYKNPNTMGKLAEVARQFEPSL